MTQLQLLIDSWPIVLSAIGFIAWLVRLEAKSGDNEKDIAELKAKYEAEVSKLFEQLSQVRESLARIEGALGVRNADKS